MSGDAFIFCIDQDSCSFLQRFFIFYKTYNFSGWMDGMVQGAREAVNLILEESYQELAKKYIEHLSIIFHGKTIAYWVYKKT